MAFWTLAGGETELGVIVNGSQKQRLTFHAFVCCS